MVRASHVLRWSVVCCIGLAGIGQQEALAAGERVTLGIQVREVGSPMVRRLGIRADRGVVLVGIRPQGAAAQAGLQPGDVVVRFGGVDTPSVDALTAVLRQATVGQSYRVEVQRNGQFVHADVKGLPQPPPPPDGYPRTFNLGLLATSAGTPLAHRMGIETPTGAVITKVRPGSAAAQAGLRRGDVIVDFAGHPTDTFEDYQVAAYRCPLDSRQRVTFVRGQQRHTTSITITSGPRLDLPWYYRHPQGVYGFRLLPEWQAFKVDQPNVPLARQYDRVISVFAGYELRCYNGFTRTADSEATLQQFVRNELQRHPQAASGRAQLGPATAAWVATRAANEPYLVYRMALANQGRVYRVDAYAPVLSDGARLPAPIVATLETLEFRPIDRPTPQPTPAPVPAPTPQPPPEPTTPDL
ncbi:MAG: PDZ domain-containing protein [Pirellulales bacterium]|nr:PDZ domain-containing protein [Pirellulales bacterium]